MNYMHQRINLFHIIFELVIVQFSPGDEHLHFGKNISFFTIEVIGVMVFIFERWQHTILSPIFLID
jgi:hypothetical protein